MLPQRSVRDQFRSNSARERSLLRPAANLVAPLIHRSAWKGDSQRFGPHRTTELAVDLYFRLAVDRGVQRDHHPDRGASVRPHLGTVELKDEVRVSVGYQRRLVEL